MLPRTTSVSSSSAKRPKSRKRARPDLCPHHRDRSVDECQIEPERWNQCLERSLYKDEVDQQINRIVASYWASILAVYDRLIQENKTPTRFAVNQLLVRPL